MTNETEPPIGKPAKQPKQPRPKKLSPAEQQTQDMLLKIAGMAKAAYDLTWGADKVAQFVGPMTEQLTNFANAGIVLQQKQWEIAASCRLCDLPDGPKHIMAGGGRGSGKTQSILSQIFLDDCQRIAGLKCLILRKISSSNKQQVADFVKKLLSNVKHQYREYRQTIEFSNGSLIILGNFKDEKDIDKYLGLEYDLIHIVESNQLTPTKRVNILSCLRTNKGNWRPRSYEDSNPGGINHVGNKRLFVDPCNENKQVETRYIHSTVEDNKFVDEGYKKFLQTLVGWQREAWLFGSWEFMAGAFFSNFHPDVHVYPNPQTKLNEREIIRWFAGLDYGFSHPTAFVLACETEGGDIFAVGEYGQPNATIEEHAANIRDMLALHHLDVTDLEFIAAGHDCFRKDKDGSTVATEYQERGIMLTPVHIDRVNAWSQMAQRFGDIQNQVRPSLFIHKNCYNVIFQIQSAQCDPKRPNDIQKMNFDIDREDSPADDYLDACFVAGTHVETISGPIPIEQIKVGDLVLTREGFKRVLNAGMTGYKETKQIVFSNGAFLNGTGNHPIFCDGEWISLDAIGGYTHNIRLCVKQSSKHSTESGITAGRITKGESTRCISIHQPTILERATECSIRRNGSSITGRYQKDSISTTKTEIQRIMPLKISNVSKESLTLKSISPPESRLLENGMAPRPDSNYIAGSENSHGKYARESAINVNIARNGIGNIHAASHRIDSARKAAWENIIGEVPNLRKSGNANYAEKISQSTKRTKHGFADFFVREFFPTGKRPVYNLEVEGCPEYFANGILVHNCRNCIVMAYSSLISTARAIPMGNYQSPLPAETIDIEGSVILENGAIIPVGELNIS